MSVSYLKPVINLLNAEVLNLSEDDTELTKEIKIKVLDYLNDKYTDPATDELLSMATFLDPRFKTRYMSTEKLEDIKVFIYLFLFYCFKCKALWAAFYV